MMNMSLVMVMVEHNCLHEDQLMGQSRAIERLNAELDYKKERLDELKESNKRMEDKIDNMNEKLGDFITKSDSKDYQLDNRLIKIETRLDEQEKATKKVHDFQKENREKTNLKIAIVGVVVAIIAIIVPQIL